MRRPMSTEVMIGSDMRMKDGTKTLPLRLKMPTIIPPMVPTNRLHRSTLRDFIKLHTGGSLT
jgi:hypothetical protein